MPRSWQTSLNYDNYGKQPTRKILTTSASFTVGFILVYMPFSELISFAMKPTNQEVTIIHWEMFQNLKTITSLHNGRHAEYVGILMDPTVYATD